MKFRKKPIAIDAIKWTGDNLKECVDFLGGDYGGHSAARCLNGWSRIAVRTLEGPLTASLGDYLICGVAGEHYPCKPDIFAATYEPLEQL
jgi:hypothetical protein